MKRDWDIIREVLIEVEALDTHARDRAQYSIRYGKPAETDATAEQALLLFKSGLIGAIDAGSNDGPAILSPELTWAGHDLLETMRSDVVWTRIKATAEEKGIELSFDAVKVIGKHVLEWIMQTGS